MLAHAKYEGALIDLRPRCGQTKEVTTMKLTYHLATACDALIWNNTRTLSYLTKCLKEVASQGTNWNDCTDIVGHLFDKNPIEDDISQCKATLYSWFRAYSNMLQWDSSAMNGVVRAQNVFDFLSSIIIVISGFKHGKMFEKCFIQIKAYVGVK